MMKEGSEILNQNHPLLFTLPQTYTYSNNNVLHSAHFFFQPVEWLLFFHRSFHLISLVIEVYKNFFSLRTLESNLQNELN